MLCKEPLYVPIFGNIVGNAGPSLAQVLEHHNFLRGIRQKFFFVKLGSIKIIRTATFKFLTRVLYTGTAAGTVSLKKTHNIVTL